MMEVVSQKELEMKFLGRIYEAKVFDEVHSTEIRKSLTSSHCFSKLKNRTFQAECLRKCFPNYSAAKQNQSTYRSKWKKAT